MRGRFITLEGPEGSGKTAQCARLEAALRAEGYAVLRTREPGGDAVGERVRDLLLQKTTEHLGDRAELLLFAAARAQNVERVVRPALEAGQIVLCDRFTDSTIAYQGYGRGLPLPFIETLCAFASGGLVPDQTFLLDLDPAVGLARQNPDKQDRLDNESILFHRRVRAGFLSVAAEQTKRIQVVDATQSADAVFEQLRAALQTS